MNVSHTRPPRFLFLATADARGHLMRAQLLYHILCKQGAEVNVWTTSDQGSAFLAEFGIQAPVLSRSYAVIFDNKQNMLRGPTDRNIAAYVFFPQRMLRDIFRLRTLCRDVDIVVNDSFHPALLLMGMLPPWRNKVVHVFGGSLRKALENNFTGRSFNPFAKFFAFCISSMIESARAWIEHDFGMPLASAAIASGYCLPTPVALPKHQSQGLETSDIAIYLNPHFQDIRLAQALETALKACGRSSHRVAEGYASRPGWLAYDPDWVSVAASSQIIITAPGMAGLAVALLFEKPIIMILTDQPEQHTNALRAEELGLVHRIIIWQNDSEFFIAQLKLAIEELSEGLPIGDSSSGYIKAEQRLDLWAKTLLKLAKDS
jgi:hypothetical protein